MINRFPHRVETRALTISEYGRAIEWCMENLPTRAAILRFTGSDKLVMIGRKLTNRLVLAGADGHIPNPIDEQPHRVYRWANPRAFYFKSEEDAVLFQIKYS